MTYFFYGTIRKYIITMLKSLNNIKVQRLNEDNSTEEIQVPIVWGNQERLNMYEKYNNFSGIRTRLPRMSITLDGINYNSNIKINRLNKDYIHLNGKQVAQYPPAPYIFSFTLNIFTKNLEDYFQILEQILPYYNPVRNFNVYETPDQENSTSIMVEISNVSFSPDSEFDEESEQRLITGSIGFELCGNIYMPTRATNDIIETIYIKYIDSILKDNATLDEFVISSEDTDLDGVKDSVIDAKKIE